MNVQSGRGAFPSPQRLVAWAVGTQAVAHCFLAGAAQLGPDEAHYALFGTNPDACYVDHPPLVGWLQAIVLTVSESERALRIWAIAAAAGTQLLLVRVCRLLFPGESPWIGLAAVLLVQSAVMFQGLSFMLLPESLLLLFGMLAVIALWNCAHRGETGDWALLGVALGFAGLSKFTAATLVPTAIAYLASENRWSALRSRGPWLAMALSAGLIAPVLVWNQQRDWISFQFRYHDLVRGARWDDRNVAQGALTQLVYYGPAVWCGGVLSLIVAVGGGWKSSGVRLLTLVAAPILLAGAGMAGFRVPLPHWTALGWLATVPLTARLICHAWDRWLMRLAVGLCGCYALVAVTVAHLLVFRPVLPFEDFRAPEIVENFHGWKVPAGIARELQQEMSDGNPAEEVPIFVQNWSTAAQVAWYGRPARVQTLGRHAFNQFDLWYGLPAHGAAGILIVPRSMDGRPIAGETRSVLARFTSARLLRTSTSRVANGGIINEFEFYECSGLR